MAKKIGSIVIDIHAGTAQLVVDMEKANASVSNFGRKGLEAGKQFGQGMREHVIPPAIAASAAIRSLEGNPGLRAAERFLSIIPGLPQLLSTAFPALGALAFGAVVVKVAGEVVEFFRKVVDSAAHAKNAFVELTSGTRLQNDALAVANDKLDQEIAKLSGKPQNGLKLALDEAIESADKLATSLSKGLKALYDLTKEESTNSLMALLKNQTATTYIPERLGGKTGSREAIEKFNTLTFDAQNHLDSAKTRDEANAIRAQVRADAQAILGPLRASFEADLQKANSARVVYDYLEGIKDPHAQAQERGKYARQGVVVTGDPRKEIENLQGTIREISTLQRGVELQFKHGTAEQTASGLRTNAANVEAGKPYQNAIDKLDAKLAGLKSELGAIGDSEEAKSIAKAMLAALEKIAEINGALKNTKLTEFQKEAIIARERVIALTEASVKFGEKIDVEIGKTKEQTRAQLLLAAAIGEGYEATKRAAVEVQVLAAAGSLDKYNDPKNQVELQRVRAALETRYEAEHRGHIQQTIASLQQQTGQEIALTAATAAGTGAVRLQAQVNKENAMILADGTAGMFAAMAARALFNATEGKDAETRTKNLRFETEQIKTLTGAYLYGADAVRAARLKNQIAGIRYNAVPGSDTSAEEAAATEKDSVSDESRIADSAGRLANRYSDQLKDLREQHEALKGIAITDKNRVGIAIALKENTIEQNRILREQVLAIGTARDGFFQFFRDIAQEGKSAAEQINNAMHQMLDGVNDAIARMVTGGKGNWKQLFQSLAASQVKQGLQDLERLATGGLGGALGTVIRGQTTSGPLGTGGGHGGPLGSLGGIFGKGLSRRDGQTPQSSIYVSMVADSSSGNLGKVIGGGGTGAGSIGGAAVQYFVGPIDARGGDLTSIYQNVSRALLATHKQAVGDGVKATIELIARLPGGLLPTGGVG